MTDDSVAPPIGGGRSVLGGRQQIGITCTHTHTLAREDLRQGDEKAIKVVSTVTAGAAILAAVVAIIGRSNQLIDPAVWPPVPPSPFPSLSLCHTNSSL